MFVRFCITLVCLFFVLPQVDASPERRDIATTANEENSEIKFASNSSACAVSIQLVGVECLIGDPNTSSDDQFLVTANVLGVEGANGFISPPFYPESTPFATNIVFGPYSATEGEVTIVVADAENPDCTDEITVASPEGCGVPDCFLELLEIEYIVGGASYIIEATIEGNGLFGWAADNGQDGDFGDRVQFGPFICGEQPNLAIRDVQEPNSCFAELTAPDDVCGQDQCFIEFTDVEYIAGNGNYSIEATVSGNGETGWFTFDPMSGEYGDRALFGPFNCGELPGINVFDEDNSECFYIFNAIPDSLCSCDIQLQNITYQIEEGLYTVSATVAGNGQFGWTSDTDIDGNYGDQVQFGPFNCWETTLITITDIATPSCSETFSFTQPGNCSSTSNCQMLITGVGFDWDGEALFLNRTIFNGSNEGTFTASTGQVGTYGEPSSFGPITCPDDFLFEVVDSEDENCRTSVTILTADLCDYCEDLDLQVEIISTDINDNGTPESGDDTWSVTLVANANLSGTYSVTSSNGEDVEGIEYGTPVTIESFACGIPFAGFDVVSDVSSSCSEYLTVESPLPNSACAPNCILVFNLIDYIIDNESDSFSVVAFIDASNSTTWQSSEGQTGPTLENVVIGPFACGEDVDVIFTDANGGNCEDVVTINSPDLCGIDNCSIEIVPQQTFWTPEGYFFVAAIENPANPNGVWQSNFNDVGDFGSAYTFGPFDCAFPTTLVIFEPNNPECSDNIVINQPDMCEFCNELNLSASIVSTDIDDAGTPNDNSDDTWTFDLLVISSISGNFILDLDEIIGTYGEVLTVGPFSCGVGPIDVEVHDVVDPNCFVVVSAFPPTTECGGSTCALTVSQLEYFNCTNDDISYCAVIVVEDGGTGSPNGWVTSNDLAGEYGEPTTIELLCANAPDLLVIEDAEDPNCSFTIELDPPANICSSSCELTAEVETLECSDDGQFYTATISFSGVEGPVLLTQGAQFSEGEPFVIQGIPTFMSPTFTIRSLEDPFCEVDVPVQAPDCEGCSIGLELNDPIFNDGGTPGDPTDDTYTIEVLVLGEFGSGSWITPNGLTGAYGESATFTFPCDEEAAIVEVFDAEDPNCSASVNLSEFYTCPEVNICDAFDLLVEYLPGENCEDIPDVQITVEGLDPPFDITVVNENGAIVFQETASLNTSFILDDLEAGVYVIEAESSTGCARGFDLLVQEGTPFEIQLDYVPNSEECGTGGFIRPTTDPTIPLQFLQWYWVLPNGSIFTDPVTPTIDVNEPGTYTYVATNTTNNCTAQASITLSPDLFLGCVSVTGTLWADEGSCELEGGEIPVPGWAVQIYSTDGTLVTYVITDDNGNWSAELPAGEYFAESSPFQPDLYTSCDPPVGFTVGNMVQHVDVLMPYVEDCVIMYTHVSVGPLRVCEEQSVQVFYCNDGPIVAENAQIEVTFDDLLSIEQVSTPPAQVFDQTYIFNLGDLAPFECGNIEFTIMVACDVELGQSQCVEVIASPNAPCPSPESSWSGATVEVEVNCDQEEGVSFRIENTGLGDMSVPLEYVIIEDVIMMMGNPVVTDPLEATAGIDISLPADGTSYVVWANQEPGSPGAMMPIASIEGCGTDENGEFTTGVINQFATSPSDLDWYRLVCRPITGSFDPNAKVGYPLGYSDENLIEPGTRLTYDLYFQNTGNDFANKVVLVDSLADEFDLNTIRLGGASHPYTYTLDSNRVLTIVFEDIMLPDSTSDPIGSQGVVQFSIDHLADLPLGTVIENEVDIYFDFNAPITTNRTRHKLDREFLPTAVENPLSDLPYWFIYPNPTANWLWIDFPMQHRELESVEIIATDLLGREVLRDDMTQGQAINLKALPAATYLLRFQDRSGRILGKAELIKQ